MLFNATVTDDELLCVLLQYLALGSLTTIHQSSYGIVIPQIESKQHIDPSSETSVAFGLSSGATRVRVWASLYVTQNDAIRALLTHRRRPNGDLVTLFNVFICNASEK